jgi:hypothetical protein
VHKKGFVLYVNERGVMSTVSDLAHEFLMEEVRMCGDVSQYEPSWQRCLPGCKPPDTVVCQLQTRILPDACEWRCPEHLAADA